MASKTDKELLLTLTDEEMATVRTIIESRPAAAPKPRRWVLKIIIAAALAVGVALIPPEQIAAIADWVWQLLVL